MLLNLLKDKKIILASGSPRRKELMAGLDIPFTLDTQTTFEEVFPPEMPHLQVPEYLAKGKSYGFHRDLEPSEILITADTMVLCSGQILGKPRDRAEATRMLKTLQGNTHTVLTGVCIRNDQKTHSFTASTQVTFGKLSPQEVEYYLDKYQPYDKAGAYGVQEWVGYVAISGIEGSYYNVMGLPVHLLYKALEAFVNVTT